jgi:hypothetical protein
VRKIVAKLKNNMINNINKERWRSRNANPRPTSQQQSTSGKEPSGIPNKNRTEHKATHRQENHSDNT